MKFGGQEMLLLFLIVLLLFGAARLPKLARSLREAKDEFQKESDPPEAGASAPAAGPSGVPQAHTVNPEPATTAAPADGPKPAGLQTEPENKPDTPNAGT